MSGLVDHLRMSESDFWRLQQFNSTLHRCYTDPTCNHTQLTYHNITSLHDLNLPGDGSPLLRTVVSLVYCAVCAMGLMGNSLVLYLLQSSRGTTKGTINFFVFNLAIADLLFSMVLPFWAVDVAMDYSWPFGWYMCKMVSFLTALNIYASAFFLTTMSVTRYCSVAKALKLVQPAWQRTYMVRLVTGLIWLGAILAAAPLAIFAKVAKVGVDHACLLRFPEGTFWLALQHLSRIILGFLIPYIIITLSYILLLRFLCKHPLNGVNCRRQTRVSKSVAVMVLSFCVCWFPNNVIACWMVLVKLDLVELTYSYYFTHTYVFPLTTCLAHVNSCLNPVIYCLMRKEHRKGLRNLLWKSSLSSLSKVCLTAISYSNVQTQEDRCTIPLNCVESQTAQSSSKRSTLPFTALSVGPSPRSSCPLSD